MKTSLRISHLACMFTAVFFVFLSLANAADKEKEEPVRCRGNFVREDVIGELEEPQLACSLTVKDGYPALKMKRQIKKSTVKVKMYETLLRVFVSGDIGEVGSYTYKLVSGEYWKGEEVITTEVREDGDLPNMHFTVNGQSVISDEDGLIVDRPAEGFGVLDYFDEMENHNMKVTVSSEDYQPCEFTIFRSMPQRPPHDPKLVSEPLSQELLYAYGMDFVQGKLEPERENLTVEISPDSVIRPGIPFEIKVTVTNNGTIATNCLVARCFSREPWLNGRWFYFGNIAPGQSAVFRRHVIADTATHADRCFLEIHFKDSWGNLPKLTNQLCILLQQ